MTTSERIAAAIKHILDEDRRADRERIAELERDLAALRCARENADSAIEDHNIAQAKLIITLNKQLDELTEKCAALVVERDQMHRQMVSLVEDPAHISSPFGMLPINSNGMRRLIDEFVKVRDLYLGIGAPALPEPHALRIDPDMSDPQPGKLLVVRLSEKDARMMRAAPQTVLDCVGFLVETPAVEAKRTPKVGDKVLVIEGSNGGRIGLVVKLWCSLAFVDQGGMMFEERVDNLKVIE